MNKLQITTFVVNPILIIWSLTVGVKLFYLGKYQEIKGGVNFE